NHVKKNAGMKISGRGGSRAASTPDFTLTRIIHEKFLKEEGVSANLKNSYNSQLQNGLWRAGALACKRTAEGGCSP
ncbi:MAG: hypothetical protein ACHQX0_06710, partial [Desulfobaccales bacterium]